uniref:CCHC-type domain-containing protein n=1 Tax=Romanomermis culicivorax TaxID=13658 RepID=A0A915JV87_ROMCU
MPLWEHPSIQIQHLSTWKQQLDIIYHLTDAQRAVNKQLKDEENNQIIYAHLGARAIRQFKHLLAIDQIWMMPHNDFHNAIITMFEQLMRQCIAFYQFQTFKQCRDKSIVKDSKCYDCGHKGHFAKYCERHPGKLNESSDEEKAVKMTNLRSEMNWQATQQIKCSIIQLLVLEDSLLQQSNTMVAEQR